MSDIKLGDKVITGVNEIQVPKANAPAGEMESFHHDIIKSVTNTVVDGTLTTEVEGSDGVKKSGSVKLPTGGGEKLYQHNIVLLFNRTTQIFLNTISKSNVPVNDLPSTILALQKQYKTDFGESIIFCSLIDEKQFGHYPCVCDISSESQILVFYFALSLSTGEISYENISLTSSNTSVSTDTVKEIV